MKKVLPLLLVALMFMACGNQTDRKENAKAMDSSEPAFIETDVLYFLENKENLVDKTIRIKGMVAHVCAH
ncbi:MAG: hypothetical protein PHU97_09275, partial [Bacteroidales bacterium]|nr:hypothetical protein [Bacteroidales bacterium]